MTGIQLVVMTVFFHKLGMVSSLKYFCQDYREISVIATGSMVRIKLQRETHKRGSNENDKFLFPVGKINQITVYSMTFDEFLLANKEDILLEARNAASSQSPLPEPLHEKLVSLLRTYMLVGGMPECVAKWVER